MLSFIEDKTLQKTIEASIEYMEVLFDQALDSKNTNYKEETYRVIILYVVGVIEAILLYVLKKRGDSIMTTTYKSPYELPKKIKHSDYPKNRLFVAVEQTEAKPDATIGVQDLVQFMKNNQLMSESTANDILEINDIRNTFHLSKSRTSLKLEVKNVEKAFSTLNKIINGAPAALEKK